MERCEGRLARASRAASDAWAALEHAQRQEDEPKQELAQAKSDTVLVLSPETSVCINSKTFGLCSKKPTPLPRKARSRVTRNAKCAFLAQEHCHAIEFEQLWCFA